MKIGQITALTALAGVCFSAQAMVIASSSFDSNTEGWLAINGSAPARFEDSGGDSEGYIYGRDAGAGIVWMFSAPSGYTGDLSSTYGGTLQFALASFSSAPPQAASLPDVKIIGGGMSLVTKLPANPGPSWTTYSVTLLPGAWHLETMQGAVATQADFGTVLSQVSALRIRGDFTTGPETTWLDSVVLATPVPEPHGWALALGGLGLLGALARRRA